MKEIGIKKQILEVNLEITDLIINGEFNQARNMMLLLNHLIETAIKINKNYGNSVKDKR